MRWLVLLVSVALAGTAQPTTGHLSVVISAELVVAEDDRITGTAALQVQLDESAWDPEKDGAPEEAAAAFGFSEDDRVFLDEEVATDLDGVNVEVEARTQDPFAASSVTLIFTDASFEVVNTVFERLQNGREDLPLTLAFLRQAGEGRSAEGGGQQHLLDGSIETPIYETPPEVDLEVDVAITFAGQVLRTNGSLSGEQERTVTWTDTGQLEAVAAAQPYGRPWVLWALVGTVLVLLTLRLVQQGNRRMRERRGEIPPPRSEVDGYLPVYR